MVIIYCLINLKDEKLLIHILLNWQTYFKVLLIFTSLLNFVMVKIQENLSNQKRKHSNSKKIVIRNQDFTEIKYPLLGHVIILKEVCQALFYWEHL
ncbi:unnamed protein product (macronuclear) [Paramecium tetraurelia]|uniref:Uncharacterized protein n=1 Tax=Paramecium tetraurelia TaxID=5888 RepID=A0CNS8_PARTE|nr:uncharacterized protein GSPATT00008887001 [Paramecium tetraurelia]CAK72445.1 unnamed protein product [Paramecium tetraurelia]|eukprot:XP_001439842.1 hypothetical protein (macronuclear) [Paramecium tetraurelia strain d4-2]